MCCAVGGRLFVPVFGCLARGCGSGESDGGKRKASGQVVEVLVEGWHFNVLVRRLLLIAGCWCNFFDEVLFFSALKLGSGAYDVRA